MIRKMKKMLGAVLLSAMVFSLAGNASVFANNCQDTEFSLHFNGTQKYTQARKKTDDSSMYMKCNSITKNTAYTAHAIGCKSVATSAARVDCSRGHVYTFKNAGQYYFMLNWVKEDGYAYARILASPNYGYKFETKGVWSPDSV